MIAVTISLAFPSLLLQIISVSQNEKGKMKFQKQKSKTEFRLEKNIKKSGFQ
jgi:hypothetical protein